MDTHRGATRTPTRTLLVLCLGLLFALAGCADSARVAPVPSPEKKDPAVESAQDGPAPAEEPQASPDSPAAPAVSYQDNVGLAFEDIPIERIVDAAQLKAMVDGEEKVKVVDIRSWADYDQEHMVGAVSIPAGQQVILRIDEVGKTATVVLVAQGTERLAEVRQTLVDLGIPEENILVLDGGLDAWKAEGYPVKTALEGETYRC